MRGPSGRGASRPRRQHGFYVFHETRITAFTTAYFPIEQGKQAQQMPPMSDGRTAYLGFGVTRHETRVFPVPLATPRRATPSPTNGFFTNHETRITKHGFHPARDPKLC